MSKNGRPLSSMAEVRRHNLIINIWTRGDYHDVLIINLQNNNNCTYSITKVIAANRIYFYDSHPLLTRLHQSSIYHCRKMNSLYHTPCTQNDVETKNT